MATFKEIVASKVGSYKQKKKLLKILQDAIARYCIVCIVYCTILSLVVTNRN